MKKQYYYKTIASMNYNEWAEAASQSWETPVLPKYTAEQLEDIFSKEEWSTSEVRDSVVRQLSALEQKLNYVWNYRQREASRMGNLVGNYLSILDL